MIFLNVREEGKKRQKGASFASHTGILSHTCVLHLCKEGEGESVVYLEESPAILESLGSK